MHQPNISDLQDKQSFSGFYLLTNFKVVPNAKRLGDFYYDFTIRDRSRSITGKLWGGDKDKEFPVPCIVKINGEGNEYQGKLNIIAKEIFLAREDDHSFSIESFLKAAPLSSKELKELLLEKLRSIVNNNLKILVAEGLNRYWETIDLVPAAKSVHHAYASGLLYHKYEMCEIAEAVCKLRPYLKRDYLIAGILLHDIAKCEELVSSMGVVTDYSRIGNLEGHIQIVVENLILDARDKGLLDSLEFRQLKHILLSHHGKLEWGSPVNPRLIEAVALHHIDNLDASLDTAQSALEELASGADRADRVFGLDGTMIYRTH